MEVIVIKSNGSFNMHPDLANRFLIRNVATACFIKTSVQNMFTYLTKRQTGKWADWRTYLLTIEKEKTEDRELA